MSFSFQYPMGTGTGVIFENGYGCGYSSTCPEPALLPFLILKEDINKAILRFNKNNLKTIHPPLSIILRAKGMNIILTTPLYTLSM